MGAVEDWNNEEIKCNGECGRIFRQRDMVAYQGGRFCPECFKKWFGAKMGRFSV